MGVHRIYVERRRNFAEDAANLLDELKSYLNIDKITDLRIIDRYDLEGVDKAIFKKSVAEIIVSPAVELSHYSLPPSDFVIPIELLPGQFDQRADSCAKNVQIINNGIAPLVKYAKIILLYGKLSTKDLKKIESFLINQVESRKASLDLPETLAMTIPPVQKVPIIDGFIDLTEEDSHNFISKHGLAMDSSDLLFCRDYFKGEGKNPTMTELKMIDTYWSDHCRHTTFFTEINSVVIQDPLVEKAYEDYLEMRKILNREDKAVTLMDIATIGAKYLKHQGILKDLDESPEINACSVKVSVDVDGETEPWLLMFKNETHNHPTEIEPFGGAATCLGGAIRDPLSGRSYVYQAMRVSGAHNPLLPFEETLKGKLPQRTISKEAAAGYSSYGNQIGIPTGLVKEIYHPGYLAKRLEMGAVVAAAPEHQVIREEPTEGDLIILLGGKTGRDGLGGATGSSMSHDLDSLETSGPQVQKGNAPEERKIQRLFRKPELTKLIKRCNDFGAGGVSVAVGELADSLHIDLDAVPLKYPGLDGTEIAISESQERMAVVIEKESLEKFMGMAKEENLEATVIAEVTSTNRLTMSFNGEMIVDLSREFLDSNGASKHIDLEVPLLKDISSEKTSISFSDLQSHFTQLLSDLNHCSQKGLSEIFDSTAGGNSVLMPYGGLYEESPSQVMAAKIPVLNGETDACSIASFGFDPYLLEANPFIGAYTAVVHSAGKIIASGGDIDKCWLSFQEYFEKLDQDPLKWGKPFAALLGALQAQIDLGLAAIGGKDSMSGTFEDLNVPPTLISVAVSLGDVSNIVSPEFKGAGNPVVFMEAKDKDILNFYKEIAQMIEDKKVQSAYAVSKGGIGEAIFEMSLGNRLGLTMEDDFSLDSFFDPNYGSFVLELNPLPHNEAEDYPGQLLGYTNDGFLLEQKDESIDLFELRKLFNKKFDDVYPRKRVYIVNHDSECPVRPDHTYTPLNSKVAPSFLIPLLPGNHGEYELIDKIHEVGGESKVFVFKNSNKLSIDESFKELASLISESQAVIFPGGMPLGNEPGGGGKYLAKILEQEDVAREIDLLLSKRDGLILGIGSGFLGLMRAGLLPSGYITPAYNHYSGFANIEICSTETPWFSDMEVGEIQKIPISSADGILSLDNNESAVAAKFLSGSIEAVTSPCGKVLGRLGHFERTGTNLYRNVPGSCSINIFNGAMKYFT